MLTAKLHHHITAKPIALISMLLDYPLPLTVSTPHSYLSLSWLLGNRVA